KLWNVLDMPEKVDMVRESEARAQLQQGLEAVVVVRAGDGQLHWQIPLAQQMHGLQQDIVALAGPDVADRAEQKIRRGDAQCPTQSPRTADAITTPIDAVVNYRDPARQTRETPAHLGRERFGDANELATAPAQRG